MSNILLLRDTETFAFVMCVCVGERVSDSGSDQTLELSLTIIFIHMFLSAKLQASSLIIKIAKTLLNG